MKKQIRIGKTKWFVYVNVTKWWLSLWIYKPQDNNSSYVPFGIVAGCGRASSMFGYEIGFEVFLNKTIKETELLSDVKSFGFRLPINFKK